MTALKGFGFEDNEKKRDTRDKPPPPARTKVPATPTEAFKTVAIPMPIRSPEEFKPQYIPESTITQRKHARVRIHEEIVIAYKFLQRRDASAISQVHKGKLVDLSEGGLQFEGIRPAEIQVDRLKTGDILIGMNIFLPYSDGRLKVLGQVTWEKPSGTAGKVLIGVKFLDMDDASKAGLRAYFIGSSMPMRKKRPPTADR